MATKRPAFQARDTAKGGSDDWVAPPMLVSGEKAEKFLDFHAEVEREIGPTNVFERIAARDISNKVVEEQLLKGMQTAIVASARVQSLALLLGPAFGQNIEMALKVAQEFYGDNEKARDHARGLVRELGISLESIEANALHLRMASIETLDGMIDRRESGRNRLIKRHMKRQSKVARAPINRNESSGASNLPRKRLRNVED
jgi:hypothetical protein